MTFLLCIKMLCKARNSYSFPYTSYLQSVYKLVFHFSFNDIMPIRRCFLKHIRIICGFFLYIKLVLKRDPYFNLED